MDVINTFLDNKHDTLLDTSRRFEMNILSSNIIFELVKDPFSLYRFVNIVPISARLLGGRAYLVNDLFVYKYDEQFKANSLSFITNLFAKLCGIRCPNLILSNIKYHIAGESYEGYEKSVQFIEYLPDWVDYSSKHPRSENFVKQLAALLAFDLVVANTDRFLFISRYIDNIIFKDEPGYEQMNLWDNPVINAGNFGFIGADMWSLDHRAYDEISYINKIHNLLDDEFLRNCSRLMGEFFELDQEQVLLFENKLRKYINRYMRLFPVFSELYNWIMSY